jgi:hypothetical protein
MVQRIRLIAGCQGARNAFFIESGWHADLNTVYGRLEALQVETALLETDLVIEGPAAGIKDPVVALTVGGVHDVLAVDE